MVKERTNILRASAALSVAMKASGNRKRFTAQSTLFDVEQENDGVFLILSGKVCLSVRGVSTLDRVFSGGSLLGLPATFTGRPYSLTAIALCDSEVVHVSREEFLQLMRQQPELCQEATEMLCRETSFINAALAQQRRCAVVAN